MKRLLLVFLVVALYVLHQDVWFWRTAQPIVFGVFPIGLFYHLCFTLVISFVMWLLVKLAWPSQLESPDTETQGHGDTENFAALPFAASAQSEEGVP